MSQQEAMNQELHQRTTEILTRLVDVLNCEDLALICWHCGIQPQELMSSNFYKEEV